jgi:DNA-binding NarL/FixJ family response regulator
LYAESLALLQAVGNRHVIADCLEGMAAVAHARGRPARAARLYGGAAALREEIGAPAVPAYRAIHEANVAAIRSALGDTAFAVAHEAGRAQTLDEAIAEGWLEERENAAQPAGLLPAPAPAPRPLLPDGLTPRELDVLRLIATGHTTQEIAQALVVAEPTVTRHITNLYAKIGVTSRAQATAYALRHGLTGPDPA